MRTGQPLWRNSCQVGWVGWGKSVGDNGCGDLGISKLCGKCLYWFLQVSGYLGWSVGYRNGACQLFCSWINFLKILVPPVWVLRLVKKSPFCIPRCFSTCCFYAVSCQSCYIVFLKVGIHFPITLQLFQSWACWFLKYLKSSPTDCNNSWS